MKKWMLLMKKQFAGFTLIEMMIVLAIIGIITVLAYPSYSGYILKSHRSDGQTALLDLANRMERYFTTNNTYSGATLTAIGSTSTSPQGYYNLTITRATASTYTLQASPIGAQANDTLCNSLTLNQLGQKSETGTGTSSDCWQ